MERRRLSGWQEIGDYLRVSTSTAQRWEERGLPVRRIGKKDDDHRGGKQSVVYAFMDEIDQWLLNPSNLKNAFEEPVSARDDQEWGTLTKLPTTHIFHVVSGCFFYAGLYAIALPLELAFELSAYKRLALIGTPLILLWIFATTLLTLRLTGRGKRNDEINRLAKSAGLIVGASAILVLVLSFLLPNRPIVRATFQTYAAPAGYLKNAIYFFPQAFLFLLLPFHFVRGLEHVIKTGSRTAVDGLLNGKWLQSSEFTIHIKPRTLGLIFLAEILASLWMMTHLLDNLIYQPGAGLFQALLWIKLALFVCLGLETLWWYNNSLRNCYAALLTKAIEDPQISVAHGKNKSTDIFLGQLKWKGFVLTSSLFILLILGIRFLGSMSANPISASIAADGRFTAVGKNGKVLWAKQFEGPFPPSLPGRNPLCKTVDLDGDGYNEVLFLLQYEVFDPGKKETLYCFDKAGKIQWQYPVGRKVTWNNFEYSDTFRIWDFGAHDLLHNGKQFTVIIANHVPYFPSQVSILDWEGRQVGEYWHTGYVFDHDALDVDQDGIDELVIGGINNLRAKPFLAAIRHNSKNSISPVAADYAPGSATGSEVAYLLFPKTDIAEVLGIDDRIFLVARHDRDRLRVESEIAGSLDIHERVYYLDRTLKPIKLNLPQDFVSVHKKLQREKLLDHDINEAEKSRLIQLQLINSKELAGALKGQRKE